MTAPRVALVLGSGGPAAHAFACGILAGLEDATGFDPRDADLVIGTSAGAQVGSLLRAGMSASDLCARVTGDDLSPEGAEIATHFVRPDQHNQPKVRWRPAQPLLPFRSLLDGNGLSFGHFYAGLKSLGRVSLEEQARRFNALFSHGWPTKRLWMPSLNFDTGKFVVFGRDQVPQTSVGQAMSASGADPGVCAPVVIDGERYVDGGVASPENTRLLIGSDVDVAIVCSALTRYWGVRRQLRSELAKVAAAGITANSVSPDDAVEAAIGPDLFDPALGPATVRAARQLAQRCFDADSLGAAAP